MKNLHHVQRIQKLKLPGLVYRKTRETYGIVYCNSKKKKKKKNGTVRQKSRFFYDLLIAQRTVSNASAQYYRAMRLAL